MHSLLLSERNYYKYKKKVASRVEAIQKKRTDDEIWLEVYTLKDRMLNLYSRLAERINDPRTKTSDLSALASTAESIAINLLKLESASLTAIKQSNTLEDQIFMKETLTNMINNGQKVLEVLQRDIKIGSQPRQIEVYFNGMGKVADTIKSLMELQKTVVELKIKTKETNKKGNVTVNQFLTSKDLLKMVKNAEDNNETNRIEADFTIEEDDFKLGGDKK